MTFHADLPASAITAVNRTPAGWARRHPEPIRTFTQAEWCTRRRKALITIRIEGFSASREISDVAGPFAERIAAIHHPLRFRRLVWEYGDAAHEFIGTATGWLGGVSADAKARTAHLVNEPGKRQRAITLLADLAQRPNAVDISHNIILDGSWAAALIAMAEPVDEPLSDLLGRAFPPGSPELHGQRSYVERLEKLLDETIDRAALAIERNLLRVESEPPPPPARSKEEQVRAELEKAQPGSSPCRQTGPRHRAALERMANAFLWSVLGRSIRDTPWFRLGAGWRYIAISEHLSVPPPGGFAGSPKAGVAGSNTAGPASLHHRLVRADRCNSNGV